MNEKIYPLSVPSSGRYLIPTESVIRKNNIKHFERYGMDVELVNDDKYPIPLYINQHYLHVNDKIRDMIYYLITKSTILLCNQS